MTETPHPPPQQSKSVVKRGLALVALVIALAILASLGTWQAGRYLQKREIFGKMDARLPMEVVAIDEAADFSDPNLEFRRVQLKNGRFELDKTVIIPRRFRKHLAGSWVVTPYRFADGSAVFVQRGWVPEHKALEGAQTPPNPAIPVTGLTYLPRPLEDTVARQAAAAGELKLGDFPEIADIDLDLLYDLLEAERPPIDFFVVLGPDYAAATDVELPRADDEHITAPYLTPMTHFGYAFLWYGSALLLIWLFWAGWTGRLAPAARRRED